MTMVPEETPPKPEHRNEDRPPLDLGNMERQVNAIQEQLRQRREAKVSIVVSDQGSATLHGEKP